MIASELQAMTDVSEMAQKLMSTCESAMAIIYCADTESGEHDTANAAFDEAASQLEELGFMHEITLDGVAFSRSEPDAGEYDPDTKQDRGGPFSRARRVGGSRLLGSSGRRCCLQGVQSLSGLSLPGRQGGWCKEHLLQILRKSVQVSQ
jgi:hypothetical protein